MPAQDAIQKAYVCTRCASGSLIQTLAATFSDNVQTHCIHELIALEGQVYANALQNCIQACKQR
jgi:hypothetical protein